MASDLYKEVPKDLEGNLKYRIELQERCLVDSEYRAAVWAACKSDVLYFFNAFCWLYEPRPRHNEDGVMLPKQIPFITWVHQDPQILKIDQYLGTRDIVVEKSRAEGMSWIAVLFAVRDWLFDDMAKVGLVSNTEKKADDPGNMDSLMAKIDWELEKLPDWMTGIKNVDYVRNKSEHSLVNLKSGGQINAFAATSDAGRAGRYKWFAPDELGFWDRPKDRQFMESIRSSTDCRLVISTPGGSEGAYYDFVHSPSNAIKIRLHWSDNPTKNRGLYRFVDGRPTAVDSVDNPLQREYQELDQEILDLFSRLRTKGFRLDGKRVRSPWYDFECDKADSDPHSIARELDLDYGGTMYRIFGDDFRDVATKTVRPPDLQGIISYDPETFELSFDRSHEGPVKLWTTLDHRNRPPHRVYAAGVDISSGLGGTHTSNSVIEVIDQVTGEQVLEFATNTEEPYDFAGTCIAIAMWFHNAYLGWEANYGGSFTKRLKDSDYHNVYYRTLYDSRGVNRTKKLGWWTDDTSKNMMMGQMSRSVRDRKLVLRSEDLLNESGQYVQMGTKIEHVGAANTIDESAKGKAHGDRVIAMGVAQMISLDRPLERTNNPDDGVDEYTRNHPPPGSMAARQKEYDDSQRKDADGWDDRGNWDLAHRNAVA